MTEIRFFEVSEMICVASPSTYGTIVDPMSHLMLSKGIGLDDRVGGDVGKRVIVMMCDGRML